MTIEIDHATNTINVNTTPLSSLSGSKEDLNEEINESLIDGGRHHDDSSSGISTNSTFQSSLSLNSLNMEIEKLQNIITMETEKHSQSLKRAKSCDDDLLDNFDDKSNSYVQTTTVLGRKSPFRDLFRRSKVYDNISESLSANKKKDGKPKKSLDLSHRSSSPFMFTLKRSNSLSSKDKYKLKRNSKSLTDAKKDLLSNASSDCNESTKLQQASPFVRTVFQFVESSFDDDYLGINAFNTHYENFIPVFTCKGMRHLPESSKTNSLPRRKSKSLTQSPFVRVIHQHSYEPNLMSTGRRIPEHDDLILSIIAYLDRIRKAKQKPPIMARRRPRQKRNKSDPAASISKFLQDLEVPSEEDSTVNESPAFSQNTIKRSPYLPMTLDQRFTCSAEYSVIASAEKSSSVKTSNSDPILHSSSFNNLAIEKKDKNHSPFTRKTKSLRNLLSSKKKWKENTYSNESISGELRRLCNLDNELTPHSSRFSKISSSSHTSGGSRNSMTSRSSGTDLVNFIKESETVSNSTSQKYPLSRTDCKRHSSDNLLALKLLEELEDSANGKKLNGNSFTNLDTPQYKNKSCLQSVSSSCSGTDVDVNTENISDFTDSPFDLITNTQSSTIHEQHEKTSTPIPKIPEENEILKHSKSSRKLFKSKSKGKVKRPQSDDIEYWTGSFEVDELPAKKTTSPTVHKKGFTDRLRGSFRRKSIKSNRCDNGAKHDELDSKMLQSPTFRKKQPTDSVSKSTKEKNAIEDKENKTTTFSSIRSIFEPLKSPSDRSKRKGSANKKSSPQIDTTSHASKQKLDETQSPPKHRNVDFESKRKAFTPPIKRSHNRFERVKQTPIYFDLDENPEKKDIPESSTNQSGNVNRDIKTENAGDDLDNDTKKDLQKSFEPSKQDTPVNNIVNDVQNENFLFLKDEMNINSDYVNASTVQRVMLMKKMLAVEQSPCESGIANQQYESCPFIETMESSHGNLKSSIVVDVPPHLLPPDVAGKSPKASPCLLRKKTGGLPSPSPLKKHDQQRYSENTSQASQIETSDVPYMCKYLVKAPGKYSDESFDIINNNITNHDHPTAFTKEGITTSGGTFTDDLDIDFTVDPENDIDYSQIPSIPQPQLLQCYSNDNENLDEIKDEQSQPKVDQNYHYSSYSSMASTLFKDLYGFGCQQASTRSRQETASHSTVDHASLIGKSDRFSVIKNKTKSTCVNVAMVPPFNKTESQETYDESLPDVKNEEEQNSFGTIKRRKTVSEKFEKKAKVKVLTKERHMKEGSSDDVNPLNKTVTSPKKVCCTNTNLDGNKKSMKAKSPSNLTKQSANWGRSHSDNSIGSNRVPAKSNLSKGTSTPALRLLGLLKTEKHPVDNSTNHRSIITTEPPFNKRKHLLDVDKSQHGVVDKNNNTTSSSSVQRSVTNCRGDNKIGSENTASVTKSQNCSIYDEDKGRVLVTRSASPTVGRRNRNSFQDSKARNNSTGHSPDITKLLQHLICDIEEEVLCDGADTTPDKNGGVCSSFKQSQLDNFNSNLREMSSQSADSLNTDIFEADRKHFRLRKTLSEDDVGLKLLREQRRKRKQLNASGEKPLQRKPSVIWARVKRMEVSLIIDNDLQEPDIVKIESFDVRRVNTHKDIEELAVDTFIKHVQLLDKHVLDLRKNDILYLKLGGHEVPIGAKFDLSSAKIQDGFLPCQLCIKGKEQWSLAAMAYDTLIPKSYLEKYLSLILSNQYVVLYGSSGTGKSYLARRLSMYVTHRMNEGAVPPIILKNITPDRWEFLLENLQNEKRDFPFVVMIDGFSQTFLNAGTDICDLITLCDKLDPKPYVICTLTQVPNKEIPPLWQQDFRWIWLPNHEEPIDGILQRYLRRKFIHHGNIHLQRESFRIADWLYSTWKYINEVLERLNSTEATLGPTIFYTCPTDILTAEEWFVDLWNYSITPYFILTAKQGLKMHGQRDVWQDPLQSILKSYPWVSEKAKRKMKLRRIRMEDVGYKNKVPPVCSTQDEVQNEQQRLFDFLRQLETLMEDGCEYPHFTKSKDRVLESSI